MIPHGKRDTSVVTLPHQHQQDHAGRQPIYHHYIYRDANSARVFHTSTYRQSAAPHIGKETVPEFSKQTAEPVLVDQCQDLARFIYVQPIYRQD